MWNSGEFSKNVADGSFKGIYPGCYIKKAKTIDGVTYTDCSDVIVSLDPYYNKLSGDARITTHHVGIIPWGIIGKSCMNTTDTTTGGYYSSYMRNTTLPKYLTGYKNAYGSDHFLTFKQRISSSINASSGSVNGVVWVATQITLLTEAQIFGCNIFSSGYDIGEGYSQLALFKLTNNINRYDFWLRGVSELKYFSMFNSADFPSESLASNNFYVRPLLLLY